MWKKIILAALALGAALFIYGEAKTEQQEPVSSFGGLTQWVVLDGIEKKRVLVLDAGTQEVQYEIPAGNNPQVEVSPNRKRLYLFDADRLKVIDLQTGQVLKETDVPHRAKYTIYADFTEISRDGRTLVTAALDYETREEWVTLIDTETLEVRRTEPRPYDSLDIACAGRDTAQMLVTEATGRQSLLDVAQAVLQPREGVETNGMDLLTAAEHDGDGYIRVREDGTVYEVNGQDLSVTRTWKIPLPQLTKVVNVRGLALTPDDRTLIVGVLDPKWIGTGFDRILMVDRQTGEIRDTIKITDSETARSLQLLPDGTLAVYGNGSYKKGVHDVIEIYNIADPAHVKRIADIESIPMPVEVLGTVL